MYNKELKSRFIASYTGSLNTANVAETVFNATEKFEIAWGCDLSAKCAEDLQPMVDDIIGLRAKSKWMTLTILKEYVKWCMAMKVADACDGMLHIDAIGIDKIKKQMVSGPMHLQRFLDEIFDAESEETMDNIYRCYFWMAYCGIDEADSILIKGSDIDFTNMTIRYKTTDVLLYREAMPAFHNAVKLTSFAYKHPNYKSVIRRDRILGDTIMRGVKAQTKTFTIRTTLSKRNISALQEGKTDLQLSFYRVRMSGVFYTMLERERAGIPVSFSEAAMRAMDGKSYAINGREKLKHRQNRMEREYLEDYQRWKLAFSV